MNLNRRQFIVAVGAAALASPSPKEALSQTNPSTSDAERKMTQTSTISLERPTPRICKITFSNPPFNLIVPETVSRLHEVVMELSKDTKISSCHLHQQRSPSTSSTTSILPKSASFRCCPEQMRCRVGSISSCGCLKLRSSALHPSVDGQGAVGANSPSRAICATPAGNTHCSVNLRSVPAFFQEVERVNACLD